jgi:hypothetical protein
VGIRVVTKNSTAKTAVAIVYVAVRMHSEYRNYFEFSLVGCCMKKVNYIIYVKEGKAILVNRPWRPIRL